MSNHEYYRLIFNSEDKKLSTIIDQDIVDTPYDIFSRGEKIEQKFVDNIRLSTLTTKSIYNLGDYIQNSLGWPICSQKMASLIESVCQNSVEIIGAPKIVDKKGEAIDDLKVINIFPKPSCIDLNQSNVAYASDGRIRGIYDLSFLRKNQITPDLHIFRPCEWLTPIIITRLLAKTLSDNKLSGVAFWPIDYSTA
jgi:hypothetical protein